jgi:hypothetical protein
MTVIRLTTIFAALISASLARSQATVTVELVGGKTLVLSAVEIAKLPQKSFTASDHGKAAAFEGVLLTDVLAKVDLPNGENFRKTAASYFVVVEARDGYRAVFAWAELDPSFTDRPVYLVTKRYGKSLSEKDGPFETIVPGEKRNSRWVQGVTALRIRKAECGAGSRNEPVENSVDTVFGKGNPLFPGVILGAGFRWTRTMILG